MRGLYVSRFETIRQAVVHSIQKDELVIAGLADQGAWLTTNLVDWQPLSIPPIRSFHGFTLAPDFESDHVAFMYGLQEGVWKTDDGGVTWRSVNDSLPTLGHQRTVSCHQDSAKITPVVRRLARGGAGQP